MDVLKYKSTGALLKAVKMAKADPVLVIKMPFGYQDMTSAQYLEHFRRGVMARCNRGLVLASDCVSYNLLHDARIVRDASQGIRWSGRNVLRDKRMIRRFPDIHNPQPY